MKKNYCFLFFIFILVSPLYSQKTPNLANYSIIESKLGDLDFDDCNELVVAYKALPSKVHINIDRELIIYKKINNEWTTWKRSKQALYRSRDCGPMESPFLKIDIDYGVLSISQHGGRNWKWKITDKYCLQNDGFELVEYFSSYGSICAYWETVQCNFDTGKISVKKEFEKCTDTKQWLYKKENETFYKKNIQLNLESRQAQEIKIITPKYAHKIYLADGERY